MQKVKKIWWFVERLTSKKRFWVALILLFVLLSSSTQSGSNFVVNTENQQYELRLIKGPNDSDKKLLSVKINGVILDSISDDPFAITDSVDAQHIKSLFMKAADEKSIKGILLEINSPGGTVSGTKTISDGIAYYKAHTKNPVVAHISGAGLSGGYWVAVSTDHIVADVGSLTGSIGVLLGPLKQYNNVIEEGSIFGSVTTEEGIETTYFTAGQYKDTGSPYRDMTPEETRHWQTVVNNEYRLFIDHVSDGRKMEKSFITDRIKALPYENDRALELKLIDRTGNAEEALKILAEKAKLKDGDYQFVELQTKRGFLENILTSMGNKKETKALQSCKLCGRPLFLYDPGYATLMKGL